jgi:hypothetical protein
MRSGDEVRVSTPVSTASGIAKPRSGARRPAALRGSRRSRSPARRVEVGQATPGWYEGITAAERGRWPAGKEVADQLRRRLVAAAAEFESARFEFALQFDAGQRPARIVERRDADDDAGVGVAFVARVLAHAVGHHPVCSEVAATTVPPGHMQKLYTERPLRQ